MQLILLQTQFPISSYLYIHDTRYRISTGQPISITCLAADVIAPGTALTRFVVYSYIYPIALGILYIILLALTLKTGSGDFGSLDGVKQLFSGEWAVVLGWVHYLVFDMFIGSWELQDSRKLGISHWVMLPCLFLTFMLGPIGLFLYLLVRGLKTGKWSR